MKLSLKRAIDKKNELTHKLKRYNETLQRYNCCKEKHEYNIHELYTKMEEGNKELEKLKLAILETNHRHGMYAFIYRLRSLTTERSNLESMIRKVSNGQCIPSMPTMEMEGKIAELNEEIKKYQVDLDAFNSKTIVEYFPT